MNECDTVVQWIEPMECPVQDARSIVGQEGIYDINLVYQSYCTVVRGSA